VKSKLLIGFIAVLLLGTLTVQAASDDTPKGHNAIRKLGRGFANVLFGVIEVPNQITKATSQQGGAAIPYGVGKGFVRWIGRELVGVYEIATFAIPFPQGYKPVMKPEFPNEDYEP
jgi:putative exosortase-associated protein (TIGR04073 family)